ncbi:hypothetical protein MJN51_41365, partial [Salmonella enterica subsp. enterica serovar Kentucky]|nr:hypothetical protein [Salmonella enterica subsp. enterica serovar Kentucky]
FSTETVHGPLLEDLSTSGIWLIISSTHGAGDIPDNLTPFYEDPWLRLRELKKAMPKTPLQMLLRGQNLLGYRHYADDVVERF